MKMKLYQITLALALLSFYRPVNANESQKLTITGQVVDYMARPVEGAEVAVIELEYSSDDDSSAKVIAPFVKTNKNGQFEMQADITSQINTFIVARKAGLAYAWDILNPSGGNKKDKGHFLLVLEKACTLTGKVVDHNGKAVPGATVQAVPQTSYMHHLVQRSIYGPKEWFTTKTDTKGVFSFNYFATDVSSTFRIKAPELKCTYKYTPHRSTSCGFEVWRTDIQLVLPQEGKIKGRVIEAGTNKPVGGLELLLQADRDTEDILNRYLPVTIATGTDGSFVCEGLPEGKNTIKLAVNKRQTADWIAEPVKFNVSPNQLTDNIRVRVSKGGIIEYTVRHDDTEQPLPGINVRTYNNNFYARTITNQQGITRQRILPGEYQASAGGDGYIAWQVNEPVVVKEGDVTRVDIGLTKSPTISGTVVGADGRLAVDILVTIHPFGDQIYTNKEGRFIAGYDVRYADADKGLYIIAMDTQRSLAAVVHTNDFKKTVKLSLNPALIVKGKIADPNGIGIPAARMSLGIGTSGLGADVLTDDQGLFEVKAIPQQQDDYNYRISIYSAGFAPKEYEKITIQGEPGTTADIGTFKLKPANLSVSGNVVDANGLPVPQAFIFVNDIVGAEQPDKCTSTNQQGQFVIKGVSADPIRILAKISDSLGGSGFTKAQGGDQDIKIVLGQELVHTPQQSLMGQSLPDISDLGIKLENAEDKSILACFFDIEQRPSRNYIMQLSKIAQELNTKDVVVLAIQSTKIDDKTLNKWIKENNIAFSVGMVEANEKQTRFNWGVKSLPWLILTSRQHIVIAEGFGLDELNEKIKETIK